MTIFRVQSSTFLNHQVQPKSIEASRQYRDYNSKNRIQAESQKVATAKQFSNPMLITNASRHIREEARNKLQQSSAPGCKAKQKSKSICVITIKNKFLFPACQSFVPKIPIFV
jgi:hypothetical protein